MKELLGRPGNLTGLILRIGQCLFAATSIGVMVSASGFSNFTAFWYSSIALLSCFFSLLLAEFG